MGHVGDSGGPAFFRVRHQYSKRYEIQSHARPGKAGFNVAFLNDPPKELIQDIESIRYDPSRWQKYSSPRAQKNHHLFPVIRAYGGRRGGGNTWSGPWVRPQTTAAVADDVGPTPIAVRKSTPAQVAKTNPDPRTPPPEPEPAAQPAEPLDEGGLSERVIAGVLVALIAAMLLRG